MADRPITEEWVDTLNAEVDSLRIAMGDLVNASIQARAHVSARRSRFELAGDPASAGAVERTLHDLDCAIAAAQGLV